MPIQYRPRISQRLRVVARTGLDLPHGDEHRAIVEAAAAFLFARLPRIRFRLFYADPGTPGPSSAPPHNPERYENRGPLTHDALVIELPSHPRAISRRCSDSAPARTVPASRTQTRHDGDGSWANPPGGGSPRPGPPAESNPPRVRSCSCVTPRPVRSRPRATLDHKRRAPIIAPPRWDGAERPNHPQTSEWRKSTSRRARWSCV